MLDGLNIWVWNWEPRFIGMAQRVGAKRLLIKALDGTSLYHSNNKPANPLNWQDGKAACDAAGIECVPWAYNYGAPGEPAALANVAPDNSILIFDPEIEYERLPPAQQAAWAAEVQALRDAGHKIGAACWARPEVHGGYYWRLGYSIDFWLPMVAWPYWPERDCAGWLDHWDAQNLGATVPWLPTYVDDAGTPMAPETLVDSVGEALRRYGGATLWAAHVTTEAQVQALKAAMGGWAGGRPAPPSSIGEQIRDDLDVLWGVKNTVRELGAALESSKLAALADVLEERIVAIKVAAGIS